MKSFRKIILIIPLILIAFFHRLFLGYIAAPLDIIVGIYLPFRDHIWNNLIAGVPFKNSLLSDVVSIIIPWKELSISEFLNKIIPLWNPYSASGSPLAANFQSAVFYPLNIIFFFNNFLLSWNIYIILITILSAIFTYLFLRQKKVGVEGSILGSVVFAFSGFMLVWLEYGVVGHAALWLPLMLYSADKIINDQKYKYLVLLSLSIGMSFLAGYPQVTFYCLMALVLFCFFAVILDVNSKKLKLKLSFLITSSILIGIALSGIQLVPSFELLQNSIRGKDPVVSSLNYGFLPPRNFLTLFAPDIFGNPATGNYFGKYSYNDLSFYLGIIPLLLALIAPVYQRNKGVRFFIFLAFLSLILATENPLSKIIYNQNIPGLSGGIASRILLLFDFSIAALSGYGLDQLIKNKNKKEAPKKFLIVASFITLGLVITWVAARSFSPQNYLIAKRNLLLPSVVYIFSVTLLLIYLKINRLRSYIPAILILIISFELVRQGLKYNPFSPASYYYPSTQVTDFLKKNAGLNRVLGTFPTDMTVPYRLFSPEGYDALLSERYSEFLGIINNKKPASGSRYGEIFNIRSPLVNLLGVKYIISNSEDFKTNFQPLAIDFPTNQYKEVFSFGKTKVYENLNAFPRAFFVNNVEIESDKNNISKKLLDLDLSKNVVLEEPVSLISSEEKGTAEIISYKSNQVTIRTNNKSDAILFLSDTYYPGWKAFADGSLVKIYRANYSFRAVIVPKGDHLVNFEYRPVSYTIGLVITALSGLILAIMFLILRKR